MASNRQLCTNLIQSGPRTNTVLLTIVPANTGLYAHYVFNTFDISSADRVINFEVSQLPLPIPTRYLPPNSNQVLV